MSTCKTFFSFLFLFLVLEDEFESFRVEERDTTGFNDNSVWFHMLSIVYHSREVK